jgi:hypothetical protein
MCLLTVWCSTGVGRRRSREHLCVIRPSEQGDRTEGALHLAHTGQRRHEWFDGGMAGQHPSARRTAARGGG